MKMNDTTTEIVKKLKNNKELTIVGPCYSDSKHLRIYSHGGLMGGIPLTDSSWWTLPTEDYLTIDFKDKDKDSIDKYIKTKDALDRYFSDDKTCKNRREKQLNHQQLYDNPEFIKAITAFAKERFTSPSSYEEQERAIETQIVYNYLSQKNTSGFIACDMEHCVPKKEYVDGCANHLSEYDYDFSEPINDKEKNPKFDIIAFNPKLKEIGFIELKCNKDACNNDSGLKTHLKDTFACMDLEFVRHQIAYRFKCLKDNDLIPKNIAGIDSVFLDNNCFSDCKAYCCFLFVKGTGLQTKKDAITICQTELKEVLEKKKIMDRLRFSFAEDVNSVDLDNMQPWDKFKNN